MTFQEQEVTGKFIAWGNDNAKENSYVVEENKPFTALVQDIKPSGKYGFIFEFKSKDCDEPLIATGNTSLKRGMGYETEKDKNGDEVLKAKQSVAQAVVIGDTVRITFLGMTPTQKGNPMYNFRIEVDR
jgi:hypothetical protein